MFRQTRALIAIATLLCSNEAWSQSYGRIVGTPNVSQTGSAQYSIPIVIPPGIHGVQPNLSLVYDSGAGYGIMGPGWSLRGLSTISRCNMTYAQDGPQNGLPYVVTLTTSDVFCLDGKRLRMTSSEVLSTYENAGTTYQTEVADFSQTTAKGTYGNGPAYFEVQGKNGLTYEYGATTSSLILAQAGTTPYAWALDKVTDRAGNYMTYTYTQLDGAFVPLSIQYTAASGSTSFLYTIKFVYTTKSPGDINSGYVAAGASVQQTQQLKAITIETSGGTDIRQYNLTYTTSTNTQRALLTSIQECGGSALNDCLPATTMLTTTGVPTYQSGVGGVVDPTNSTGSTGSVAAPTVTSIDIDGDGQQDLLYATVSGSTYTWYVQFATASGYSAPVKVGFTTAAASGRANVLVDTFEGTQQNEILVPSGSAWAEWKWNGGYYSANPSAGFVQESTLVGNFQSALTYASADVNGDGLADIVSMSGSPVGSTNMTTAVNVQINTLGGSAHFAASQQTLSLGWTLQPGTTQQSALALFGNNYFQNTPVKKLDFDGDGRDDLLIVYETKTGTQSPTFAWYAIKLFSHGTSNMGSEQISDSIVMPVNWNDDNCTDLVGSQAVYLSDCGGTTLPGNVALNGVVPLLALDWDGDGRTDLLARNAGGDWEYYISTGTGISTGISTTVPTGSGPFFVTDQNGDGLDDVINASANPLTYGLHQGAGQKADLLTSIEDGYGNSFSPTYVSIVGNATYTENWSGAEATYPYENYIGPMYVVNLATFSDPSNQLPTYNQGYSYVAGWINLQGRGFAGFAKTMMTDSRYALPLVPLTRTRFYWQFFPYTGGLGIDMVTQSGTSDLVGEWWATPAATTLDSTTDNERYFPYGSPVVVYQYELGGTETGDLVTTSSTAYTYDTYGNATTVATTVTDNDPGSPWTGDTWTTTATNTITPDTSTWCLNLPSETQVQYTSTAPGATSVTRTANYTPDYTNCRQNEKVTAPSTAYQVTEVYSYDSFGNLNSDAVTGTGMATRTTSMTWGTAGQFPTIITNALGQSITRTYDPNTGMMTSQTDPNWTSSNKIQTTWVPDDFGRKKQENRPDGTSTTWTYQQCSDCPGTVGRMEVIQQTLAASGGALITESKFDSDMLDRLYARADLQLSAKTYSYSLLQYYDSLGRISTSYYPYLTTGSPAGAQTFTHDTLNRLIQFQKPISSTNSGTATTTFSYAGRTSSMTDALTHTTRKISQVTGKLGRTVDAYGYYVNLGYDAYGSLTSVADSTAVTLFTGSYQYGIGAFQTSFIDADLGTRSNTIDPLGEVTAYTDSNGNDFSTTYDMLSRPMVRTEPDLTTTWTWGSSASSYNIGKLASAVAKNTGGTKYTETYNYDSLTRLSSKTIAIPVDASYTYAYSYAPLSGQLNTGLLTTLTYPQSTSGYQLKLNYGYTNGILSTLTDATAGTVYWTANSINPRGQVTEETLGDGVVTTRAFDAVNGWLGTIESGAGGGSGLQYNAYTYDEMNNVTYRQDLNQGLNESFAYDNDYRLTCSSLTSANCSQGNSNLFITYAANGNITTRSDVQGDAAWTYSPTQVHAVTAIGANYSDVYDHNGNMTSRNGGTINWTSYNYPSSVAAGTETATFSYGPNRQRYETAYSGSIGTETTFHVGKLLEKVQNANGSGVTDWRYYIYAGNEYVGTYSTQANKMWYVLGDHQSSFVNVLQGATGSVTNYVRESFTAFGVRRSGETWSGAPNSTDESNINSVSRFGYTNQAVLGVSMGLNHMNGRVEDAVTGRFLSPDPNVPDPADSQSYNRYSYVRNSPLTLVDPSGFKDRGCPSATENCDPGGSAPPSSPMTGSMIPNVNTGAVSYGGSSGGSSGSSGGSMGGGIAGTDSSGDGSSGSGSSGGGSSGDSAGGPSSFGNNSNGSGLGVVLNDPNDLSFGVTVTAQGTASTWQGAVDNFLSNLFSGSYYPSSYKGRISYGIFIPPISIVAEGPVSAYVITSARGALVPNVTTDVTAADAGVTLEGNGYAATTSADGEATVFTNSEGNTYILRPSESAPEGQALDFYPNNGNGATLKINLGGPPYSPF